MTLKIIFEVHINVDHKEGSEWEELQVWFFSEAGHTETEKRIFLVKKLKILFKKWIGRFFCFSVDKFDSTKAV